MMVMVTGYGMQGLTKFTSFTSEARGSYAYGV